MKAMIFAAGLGTRLKPLTDNLPKALVPVGGRTLLEHVIMKLKSAGYDDIVINIHHFGDMIEDFVREHDCFGIGISISDERDFLRETGGGILHARKLLEDSDRFLVHNVDILSNLDLRHFDSLWKEDAVAQLLVSDRKTTRYLLFDDDMRLVGWKNTVTGETKSPYSEVPNCRALAFSGIHLVSGNIFLLMENFSNGREKFSIIDFYLSVCDRYPIYGTLCNDLKMIDVGKLDSLAEAESIFKDLAPVSLAGRD